MSSDNSNSNDMMGRQQRRGSVTQAAFSNLFRSNSISQGTSYPNGMANGGPNDRRRLSITTLGLSTNNPTTAATPFGLRRSSQSTSNSDAIDENAVDDDDGSTRTAPTTPFTRRMSFGAQAMLNMRTSGTSPGSSNDQGFNWSEQLRTRAESSVTGSRPSFSFGSSSMGTSPPGGGSHVPSMSSHHDRAKSVSDMPAPPAQAPKPRQPQKPDHFQERILKGDFYMD